MADENTLPLLPVFRFEVQFYQSPASPGQPSLREYIPVCNGSFSECTGLEATMEPMIIRAGGQNYGSIQRVGKVTFATVILKRGMTSTRHLWKWFELVTSGGKYAYRMDARIVVNDVEGNPQIKWIIDRALPIKFKAADLNAMGINVGIEELHLVHEGLRLEG